MGKESNFASENNGASILNQTLSLKENRKCEKVKNSNIADANSTTLNATDEEMRLLRESRASMTDTSGEEITIERLMHCNEELGKGHLN